MRILTVCQAYPNQSNPSAMAFVHSRNLLYKSEGHHVDVLSFSTGKEYSWEGIKIFPEDGVPKEILQSYDSVVFHAPNLRNHLRFLFRNRKAIRNLTFIVHMTEWLNRKIYYPKPYPFLGLWKRRLVPVFQNLYDTVKLRVWRSFLKSRDELKLIFVSNWIREQAERSIGINLKDTQVSATVIHNPIHPTFMKAEYVEGGEKDADFITIRPFDDSKYGVDIVCDLAEKYPSSTFHVYGRGKYFSHRSPPNNLKVIDKIFPQQDIPAVLNRYRAAILPTRLDSQGVLMCEIAATGMPLVVSDLSICKEMVGDFSNVAFLSNSEPKLPNIPRADVSGAKQSSQKFFAQNTVREELQVFKA